MSGPAEPLNDVVEFSLVLDSKLDRYLYGNEAKAYPSCVAQRELFCCRRGCAGFLDWHATP